MLSGRKGMRAAFGLGRWLSRKQLARLGFRRDRSSGCHVTFTETLRLLDRDALPGAFSQFTIDPEDYEGNETIRRQLSIDRKTLCDSNDQMAMASMSCRLSARRLANSWAIVHHEVKVWKYLTPSVWWKRLTLRA